MTDPYTTAALFALAVSQILDVITTEAALRRPGTQEGNGFVAWMMRRFGRAWAPIKAACAAAIAWAALASGATLAIWVAAVGSALIALHNTRVGR